ncbi:MAG: hypothetical protein M3T55_09705, partial [Pseudomonadota bacterium]|nr:hypothetical protein [Pseudomonadota bacterium]
MRVATRDDGYLDLTAYASDPVGGDWTDILLSAIAAGHRRIHLDDRQFAFAMSLGGKRAIAQPCELVFGAHHEVSWAGPSLGPFRGSILAVRGAGDVSISGPNIVGAPMMDVSGGKGANCHCYVANSSLTGPVVVIDGGAGYRDACGYPDGHFDFPALDVNNGNIAPRAIGVVRFQIAEGKIVGGSIVSPGAGYVERRQGKAPAMMLGAAFPGASIYLGECGNPRVSNVRQVNGCGVITIFGGAGARILKGHARDLGSAGVGVQIGPTDDVVVSGWDIKGVHGGIYHTAGIRLTAPLAERFEDPVTSRVRITDNVVDDVNSGSCFDAVVCGLRDIRFERNTAIQRRPGGFFCMQIKLGRPSRNPKAPGGGVRDVVYRDNRAIQHAPGGMAVDFQNNSKWDDFEVDFDRSNTIEYTQRADIRHQQRGAGANSCGLRVHNLTSGTIAPTILFATVGVRPTGRIGRVVFSPRVVRCRIGILSDPDDAQGQIVVEGAEIHASEAGALLLSRGAHRLTDCTMIVRGYRLAERAEIVSAGSGLAEGEWSVFAAGSGSGLVLRVRIEDGKVAAADLLAPGQDYLNNGAGEFLLDVAPDGRDGAGGEGVVAVEVAAGRAISARVIQAGDCYLDGGSGAYEPMAPEHAHLVAIVRGGQVVEVKVLHSGWRFHQPPVLQIDPAAGGGDASITIGLTRRSFGAWFADAEGAAISGGHYEGASGDIGFASDRRTAPPADRGDELG